MDQKANQQQNINNQNQGGENTAIKSVMWPDDFKDLLNFLHIIRTDVNDFPIVKGRFRTRSNDLRCVIETYFECLKDMEFIIGNISGSLKTLSNLDNKSHIAVTADDQIVTFSDGYQTFRIVQAHKLFCDNKFMPIEELDAIFTNKIDNNRPLVKETLSKGIVSNINRVAQNLNTQAITFTHQEENLKKGRIIISQKGYGSSDRSDEYSIALKEDLLTPMYKDLYLNLTTLPYSFNNAEMTIDFRFLLEENILAAIHHTSIGQLSITIYARSAYVEGNEDQS
jgi:hypothetical protein